MQNEIRKPTRLLDEKGELVQRGYAKKLLLEYDRGDIKAAKHRIKEWDYYLIANDKYAVALTIDDNSYMGLVSASLLDFEKPWERTKSIMSAFPMGKTNFPSSSGEGDVSYCGKQCRFRFFFENGKRRLVCSITDFLDKKPFKCDITLSDEPEESMVIATPYKEDKKAFYYNQKINCMRACGSAEFDGRCYEFEPETSFGTLDWGRGVWTYSNTWYWGSLSGQVGGKPFGFNIGYGFGDTSAASENMLFYDGRAHKTENVTFNIPMKNGREDYLSPWTFSSSDGRFEMDFVPIIDRASCSDVLLIKSDQHQVFGRFSGTAVLDSGERIEIKDMLGFAEKVMNRW
ncbi:MAG: DUF2804 domain-containing protein [Oscillospiraceae bacterium]